jgi:hypothetical protein
MYWPVIQRELCPLYNIPQFDRSSSVGIFQVHCRLAVGALQRFSKVVRVPTIIPLDEAPVLTIGHFCEALVLTVGLLYEALLPRNSSLYEALLPRNSSLCDALLLIISPRYKEALSPIKRDKYGV